MSFRESLKIYWLTKKCYCKGSQIADAKKPKRNKIVIGIR